MFISHSARLARRVAAGSAALALLALTGPQAAASCGCASMTIEADRSGDGYSNVLCAPAGALESQCIEVSNPDVPPEYRCSGDTVPWQCPLGLHVDYSVGIVGGYGFEVMSKLTPGSDPADCRRGQVIQSTRFRNGVLIDNPPTNDSPPGGTYTFGGESISVIQPPALIPQVGRVDNGRPVYGADNYTTVQNLQRALPDLEELYWWDSPQGAIPINAPNTRSETDIVITYVEGGEGRCWCRFELKQAWDGNGGTGAAAFLAGENCTLVQ